MRAEKKTSVLHYRLNRQSLQTLICKIRAKRHLSKVLLYQTPCVTKMTSKGSNSERALYALSPSFKDLQQCVVALIREVALASVTHRFGLCDHLVVEMFGLYQTFCGEFSQETSSLKGPTSLKT